MPAGFDKCVKNGGRVRTVSVGKNRFFRVCFLNGKSFKGETKTKKKK